MRRSAAIVATLAAAALAGALTPSCSNPVQDAAIAALGPEVAGVPPGPNHRPGQPCLVCHSVYGGKQPEMVVGGTVFADAPGIAKSFNPVQYVDVVLTDAVGETRTATTGCNGNFYISKSSWNARFPLAAEIRIPSYNADGTPQMDSKGIVHAKVKAMGSVISRDGSCASCHQLSGRAPKTDASGNVLDYNSTGWLYCNATGDTEVFPDFTAAGCAQAQPPPFNTGTSSSTTSASTGAGG